jgi:hypothetical protein
MILWYCFWFEADKYKDDLVQNFSDTEKCQYLFLRTKFQLKQ